MSDPSTLEDLLWTVQRLRRSESYHLDRLDMPGHLERLNAIRSELIPAETRASEVLRRTGNLAVAATMGGYIVAQVRHARLVIESASCAAEVQIDAPEPEPTPLQRRLAAPHPAGRDRSAADEVAELARWSAACPGVPPVAEAVTALDDRLAEEGA